MIVTEKLPVPPVRGGAIQTYVAAVAPLLAHRFDLTVLGVTDPTLPEEERVDGVHYVRVPGGNLDRYRDEVLAFLKSRRFDLIHIFNRPLLVLPVRQAAPNARLILSLHNDMFEPYKIPPKEAQAVIDTVERLVTVSDYVGRRVAELYPAAGKKWRTIYSGVDVRKFLPVWAPEAASIRRAMRRAHGLEGKKVILFVGRLSPKKGADVLVRAMPSVARVHPDVALVLVGSKWYGEQRISDYVAYVRALAARAPVPVVTTGFVPPDQIPQWFLAGDVFVCPSLWNEPLARVHYEAMASGLPIITTNRGGNPEVVAGQGVGLVVDQPEDPRAMAAAIIRLLDDRNLRERMGRTGRRLAEERYPWSRVAREIVEVWTAPRR